MRIFPRLLLCFIVAASFLETAGASDFRVLAGHAFDGQPITLSGSDLKEAASGLETEIVAVIMRHAGLPQNFVLYTDAKVANVAAVILVDKDGRGKRALVCNEKFMRTAQEASNEGNWAPVSIIAHEIGHHIEGQTLVAGDWQAHGELAADAFSGFILYKLGAKLGQAGRAVNTLAMKKDDTLSRDARLRAVQQGWMLACRQQADNCETGGTALLLPTPTTIEAGSSRVSADKPETPVAPAVLSPVTSGHADILPLPDRQDIPVKFGKFVIDELGVLDRAARTSFERRMFEVAAKNQVEIVTIVSKDLHGLTADEYAQAMLRQLAVGSREMASGAVLLVAPQEKQVGMALAPGLLAALGDKTAMAREHLKNFKEFSLIACQENCRAEQTAMLFHAAAFVADMTGDWDSSISYPKDGSPSEGGAATGAICLRGKILEHDTPSQIIPSPASAKQARITLKIISDTGREALLSLDPDVEKLAPAPLATGNSYQFITRELAPRGQIRQFEVLSYAPLP